MTKAFLIPTCKGVKPEIFNMPGQNANYYTNFLVRVQSVKDCAQQNMSNNLPMFRSRNIKKTTSTTCSRSRPYFKSFQRLRFMAGTNW